MKRRVPHLRVNPILCDAYGHCAELLPELIELDEWGYPIIDAGPVPSHLEGDARRAVSLCPRLALHLEQREPQDAPHDVLVIVAPTSEPATRWCADR